MLRIVRKDESGNHGMGQTTAGKGHLGFQCASCSEKYKSFCAYFHAFVFHLKGILSTLIIIILSNLYSTLNCVHIY